ncbi:MAG: hypothetical protein AAF609_10365 [Cyanobacteria bacterium P01_C01_bin.120]
MRIRWFPVAGLCLSVAVWQGGIDASFGGQTDRLLPSAPSLENHLKADSNAAAIELVDSLPGRFIRYDQVVQAIVTHEPDDSRIRLFELDGSSLLSLKDTDIQFSPDGQMMVLTEPGVFGLWIDPDTTTYLLTLAGVEIAQFPGLGSRFLPDTELLVIQNPDGQRSRLVDLTDAETAIFEGWYLGSTAEVAMLEGIYYGPVLGPQNIVTYSMTADRYYLYDLNGTEIASFPGDIEGWVTMPDNQGMLVFDGEQTRRFDRNGVELATYSGQGVGTLPDGQAIFLNADVKDTSSRLVSLDGEELAAYTGLHPQLAPDHQRVITRSFWDNTTRIHRLDGTEIAAIPGDFWEFSPDGKHIMVNSYQEGQEEPKSSLYTLDGIEIATYMGVFEAFWPDTGIVVTSTFGRSDTGSLFTETHLHSLEGELLATVAGEFGGISPNQEVIAVSSNSSPPVTDLYRIRMDE